jgi:hypothetical protein
MIDLDYNKVKKTKKISIGATEVFDTKGGM